MVVVDAEGIDRSRDDREVSGVHDGLESVACNVLQHIVRVFAPEDRIEKEPVELAVDASRRITVPGIGRIDRVGHREVERDTQLQAGVAFAELLYDESVTEQQVMRGGEPGGHVLATRRMFSADIAEKGCTPRLIESGPGIHTVTEHIVHGGGIFSEPVGGVPVGPATLLLERLRKVPVVQREPRSDVLLEQLIDELRIKGKALFVYLPTVRTHP